MLLLVLLSILSFTALIPAAHVIPNRSSSSHSLAKRGSPVQIRTFLFAHNLIRAAHNATDLTWSVELTDKAAQWADACNFQRTEGVLSENSYGELHAAATGIFSISTAINQFAKDADEYDPVEPTYNHWTQIVWKSTTQVGCARSQCNNMLGPKTGLATYYVCLYDPAGNVIGQAPENVQVSVL